jgi:hypothetical protein
MTIGEYIEELQSIIDELSDYDPNETLTLIDTPEGDVEFIIGEMMMN